MRGVGGNSECGEVRSVGGNSECGEVRGVWWEQ